MPLWENNKWHLWVPAGDRLIKLEGTPVASEYVAKAPADTRDIHIPFVDMAWQHFSYPNVHPLLRSICTDIRHLSVSLSKMKHTFETREQVGSTLVADFFITELEYLLAVTRSIFDLMQEVMAALWNDGTVLLDTKAEELRKQHKLTDKSFRKVVFREDGNLRSAEELVQKYSFPVALAEGYANSAAFFKEIRDYRDKIIHGGTEVGAIYVTEKGFCVSPDNKICRNFFETNSDEVIKYNDSIVSIVPWLNYMIMGTIESLGHLLSSFAKQIKCPPEVAPGYRVFIRNPANNGFSTLLDYQASKNPWWK